MSKSNGVKKYLKNGAISPLWQEIQYQKACDKHDIDFATDLARSVSNVVKQPPTIVFDNNFAREIAQSIHDSMNSTVIVNTKQELEDRFEFLNNHNNTPEELELAKLVLQSYRS